MNSPANHRLPRLPEVYQKPITGIPVCTSYCVFGINVLEYGGILISDIWNRENPVHTARRVPGVFLVFATDS